MSNGVDIESAHWVAITSTPWCCSHVETEATKVNGEVREYTYSQATKSLTEFSRYFINLKVSAPIQRNNLFIQPVDGLFHWEDFDEHPVVTKPDGVFIRTELQSLRRLPKSDAIVFSVRTYLTPLSDLKHEPEALERLWDAVRNYPEVVGKHKVKHLWNDVFEKFCKETLGREDPEIDPDTGNGVGLKSSLGNKTCPAGFA